MEARAEARAVASVVGREALRECVRQKRRRCCVPVEKEFLLETNNEPGERTARAEARAVQSPVHAASTRHVPHLLWARQKHVGRG